jgi:hypothetical protein
MTATEPSAKIVNIDIGLYQGVDGYFCVTDIARHVTTGERMVVFSTSFKGKSFVCSEEEFVQKGLTRVLCGFEKRMSTPCAPLDWLWNTK